MFSLSTSIFSQEKDSTFTYYNFNKIYSKFSRGEYIKAINEIDFILKSKISSGEKAKINEIYEKAKLCVLLNERIKYYKSVGSEASASNFLDSLFKINPNDPRIVKSYLKLGDKLLKIGELPKAQENYNKYLMSHNTKGLNSRLEYLRLLQIRAKYQFTKENVQFYWIDEYATLLRKSVVASLKRRTIDSLFEIQKDSLKYKRWKRPVFLFAGVGYDYLLTNNDRLNSSLSTVFGLRLNLTEPMHKLSYFAEIRVNKHELQNIEILEGTNYLIETFRYSYVSIPVNIKYNITNKAGHLYTNAGIAPNLLINEKYINSIRNIEDKKMNIIEKFQITLNGGLGLQFEGKKKRNAAFLEINGKYYPFNTFNGKRLNDEALTVNVFSANMVFGYKF